MGWLRETSKGGSGTVEFLLVEIKGAKRNPDELIITRLTGPFFSLDTDRTSGLKMIQDNLGIGATVVGDIVANKLGFDDLFEYVDKPPSGFRRTNLPFSKGRKLIAYDPAIP